jgi:UDP-glucose 4-epimerase
MEMYANASYNLKGLHSFGLRFFNVYGPRQDASNPYSGVISIFIDRLLNNDSININGGHQTRDFVYVKDVVNTIFKSYEHLLFNKVANISNVLTGNSITINDLVKSISNILKIDPKCIYKELPPGDPECSLGSIELMEKLLNVKANSFKSIEYGLKETIEYIKLVRQ